MCAPQADVDKSPTKQWYKGNTHTHTLWSDGNAAPETVAAWYKDKGYDFLCLSEHNIFADGSVQRFYPITEEGPLTPERVEGLRTQYGKGWVETQEAHGRNTMRLGLHWL